ncbi:hypothetical protein, partial [Vibrio parahaemolyticus]|uniref:hypothetical protein n=1 Tax=Vibrio parahaemolyticus TaxID=670 RepID=UPI0011667E13
YPSLPIAIKGKSNITRANEDENIPNSSGVNRDAIRVCVKRVRMELNNVLENNINIFFIFPFPIYFFFDKKNFKIAIRINGNMIPLKNSIFN